MMQLDIVSILKKHAPAFHRVVTFDEAKDKLFHFDFTKSNKELTEEIFSDTGMFSAYVSSRLENSAAKYGIGGYNEDRIVYARSDLFNNSNTTNQSESEPRRVHLGVDIWGEIGTPVFAPLGGMVHSFAFNNRYGDYGATIVLLHQLDGMPFYTLYGHLSVRDLVIQKGNYISRGQEFAHFGKPEENGYWPPHLHFQIILDMQLNEGDYPGVCKSSERNKYLSNCQDPDLILQMNKFL